MDFYAEGKAAVLPAKDDAVTDTTILDDDDEARRASPRAPCQRVVA